MQDIAELHARLKRSIALNGRREAVETIPADPARRNRSLRACHLPSERKPVIHFRETRAYVPELAETLERDPNLCDGARRCARLLGAYTYRRARDTRTSDITVTYLARALGRCRRTVQRYLRQLERAGYIRTDVIASERSRMCAGLAITLLRKLFPRHHAQKWPSELVNSDATRLSQKHRLRYKTIVISIEDWAQRCRDGVHRAYMKTLPPFPPLL
jgi:hypothetical protein